MFKLFKTVANIVTKLLAPSFMFKLFKTGANIVTKLIAPKKEYIVVVVVIR